MSQSTFSENKMGVMPIPKLLITIATPMVISMLVQALYNIVDSIFVSKLGEDALTAVSLTFPIQNLIIAVAVGTAVALNALISRYLGANELEKCSMVAKHGILLAFLSYLVFAIIGIFGSHIFFASQTDNQTIVTYGTQYMSIISIFSFGVFFQITFERFVQSTGRTVLNMIMQGTGAIINIILDPILIFGLFGFPRFEVMGAALATIIGQICAALIGLFFVLTYTKEININMKGFKPNKETIISIYQIGVPAILMQSIGSIMVFGMNAILLMFTTTATAVFGIYFKLQSFIFMPIFGLTNGLISIVAYNYGAKNKKRIMESFKLSCIISTIVMIIGSAVFFIFPSQLLSMFDASEDMMQIGTNALTIIAFSFAFAGFSIICSAMFQALGNAVYSLIISVARQLVVMLPVAYLLASLGGLDLVWYALPIAEVACCLLCAFLMKRIYNHTVKNL
ncbi:MAG: MATE family efflux transporter [Eubacteriales bacterium]